MDKIVDSGCKFDLHIHSAFSSYKDGDKVKNNTTENIPVLLDKLNENQVNICAITDHDVFNYDLYNQLKKSEGKGSLKKVLPGIEFSVRFTSVDSNKVIHIVTIFNDSDDLKVKEIEEVLALKNHKPQYDADNAFSEEKYFEILRKIDIDTIMIAHQKNSLASKGKAKKNDALALGEERFNELLFLNYFEAYEFRNKKNQLFNKKYIAEKKLDDDLRMLTGSDCHCWECYPHTDEYDNGEEFAFSYCKCLPTFKGLIMAVTDYKRIKLTNSFFNPTAKGIDKIKLEVDGKKIEVPLSKGINVIIGDNSIGKSLLIHALTNYKYDCNAKLKAGYTKYLKEKKTKISNKIIENSVFKCDMQGHIRKQFEEDSIKGSEFLSPYFPEDIDARVYRSIIEQELEKYYGQLQAKFDYDKKVTNLSSFELINSAESKSITYVGTIRDQRKDGLDKLTDEISTVIQNIRVLLKSKDLESQDKDIIEEELLIFIKLKKKYSQKICLIKKENLKRNFARSVLKEIRKKSSRQISDEQKIISSYLESKAEIVNDICELIKMRHDIKKPEIRLERKEIAPNTETRYKYKFVSKLNIDSISEEYLESIFSRVLKRNKKIDFEKITSSALKSYIPYYPIDKEQPLEAFKQKIKEILDKDFDSRHSIIENGMDVYKELSAGFNSQIYFSLIASETRDKGIYIVDQPEDNISQKAIRETVLEDIKEIGYARQVIMVTHNPQFIVNLDVDNVIFLTTDNNELIVQSGALEYECQEYKILSVVAENIDGGLDSISRRLKRYEKGI